MAGHLLLPFLYYNRKAEVEQEQQALFYVILPLLAGGYEEEFADSAFYRNASCIFARDINWLCHGTVSRDRPQLLSALSLIHI